MADFLNQELGSESEDDNFNPAPADESENGVEGGSDEEVQQPTRTVERRQRPSSPSTQFQHDSYQGDENVSSPAPINGDASQREDGEEADDEDAEGLGEDLGDGDDDEDEEEEDDDDEEAITSRPRKKRRRDPRNQYLDIEAEVNEDEEGDEEDEEGVEKDFIAETHPDDLADLPDGADTDDRRHRELDRQREQIQQLDAEKQAEILRERYGRSRAQAADQAAAVPKRLLLPSVDDPGIWGVKCKPGKEKEVVFSILRRMEERAMVKKPFPIISAFERGATMPGRVYIECAKQADVINALTDISNIYPRTGLILVEIKERPDLLRVRKSKDLQPGGYVRIKRGKYQGDLAQIDGVEANDLVVSLRIVPRLDYGLSDDTNAPMINNGVKGDTQKRKRAGAFGLNNPSTRPPPRLFSENEAKKKHARYLQSLSTLDRKHWTYQGETYINGYLIKDVKIQHLVTEGVNPTLEEVTKFAAGSDDGTENLDLSALAQTLKNASATDSYLPGDTVEVFEGEQQGVSGKVLNVRGEIITVTVTQGELKGQRIEIPIKSVRKIFKEGDHVKVIGGSRYRDEVGMVVRLKKDTVTILSDLSMQEITVFSKDLREASDSGVAGGLGLYDIHDLVQLDASTVGCVTKVDRESLRVLDQNGSVRTVMPSQISNKLERRRNAVSTDRNGSEIRNDDTVRESGGENRQGVVFHIYRSFLFIHNREQTENSGISVLRSTNVVTVAAKGGRVAQTNGTGPDLTKMNPAMMRNGANGNNSMPPPKSFGRDRALGQTVTVRRGPYKGLLGIVKDTTDTSARVELHTKGKTITVAKDTLAFKDPLTGASIDYTRFAGARGRSDGGGFSGANGSRMSDYSATSGSRTPAGAGQADRIPAWGQSSASRTPAWGAAPSRTPAYTSDTMSGGRTPAYGRSTSDSSRPSYSSSAADGARTAYGGGAGDRTAYGGPSSGAGGRTPAWGDASSSRTPAHSSSTSNTNGSDPFAPSARTPYHDPFSSSRTPAYEPPAARTPSYSAPSNDPWASTFANPPPSVHQRNPYDAPTPSMPKDAPTPAYGASAPTPAAGGVYNAPTPAGGYNAPTPAAVGHTPRYETYAGDAPTPYGGEVQTPAAGGGAGVGGGEEEEEVDGPGYEEGTPSP